MKFSVVRKKGFTWTICSLRDSNGKLIKGAKTSDKAVAIDNRDKIAKVYPEHTYAILELEK